MTRRLRLLLLCLCWLTWSAQWGCTSQVIDDDDWLSVAMRRASKPERALREKAMSALGQGKAEAERRAWQELLARYPTGWFAGLAHMRVGLYHYKRKAYAKAVGHFAKTRALKLSPQERDHILMHHARALDALKQDQALQALLTKHYKSLGPRRQKRAIKLLIKSHTRCKDSKGAFNWRMKLLTMAQGGDQEALRQKLILYIKSLSPKKLKAFVTHAASRNFRFPLDYMSYRYASLIYGKDQYKQAKVILEKMLKEIGLQHPLYKKTRKLLAEVKEIRRPADALTIGVILPETGPGRAIGVLMKNAVELGITDYPQVKLVYKDSAGLPSVTTAAVDQLVRIHKAIAIIGPPLPKQAVAAAKRAQTLGVPLISITAREKFPDLGSFIFRNNFTLSAMGRAVARYGFQNLRIKRFGVLYSATKYGRTQAQAFLNELRRLGALLTSAVEYDPNTTDFQYHVKMLVGTEYTGAGRLTRRHLQGLKAFQKRRLRKKLAKMMRPLMPFEGLFVPEQAKITSQIAAYLASNNVDLKRVNMGQSPMFYSPLTRFRKIQLLGNNNWYHKDLFQAGKQYIKGGVFCVRFYPGSYRSANQTFVQLYHRTHSKAPIHLNAFAYDAMRLFAHVASSGKVRTRPQFRRALLKIKQFEGPTGPMQVATNGEVVGPVHFVMAYNGQFRLHGTLK